MNPAEEYILNQEEPFRAMLLHLKSVVEHTIPGVTMKRKWGIPCFYADQHPICYMNVAKAKRYLDVAFWNSAHLTKHLDHMVSEKRKVVKSLRYTSLQEIDDTILMEVLEEAYALRTKGFYKRD